MNSKGQNTSALYGFTQTLVDLLQTQSPTHLAAATDTPAPTERHELYPEYKAHRDAMPEDLVAALPGMRRVLAAFRVPLLVLDGFEADDLIGTVVSHAPENCDCFMVTPDKDFGQLVSNHVFILKPSKGAEPHEILGVPEVLQRWGITEPRQVIDILALMGDASDNIPGARGVGEKTAAKLIAEFGTIENLLANTASIKGKLRETLEADRGMVLLSKRLATIRCDAPISPKLSDLVVQAPDLDALRVLFDDLEFRTLAKRVFGLYGTPEPSPVVVSRTGDFELNFTQGQASSPPLATQAEPAASSERDPNQTLEQQDLMASKPKNTVANTTHHYIFANTPDKQKALLDELKKLRSFCFDLETTGLEAKTCRPIGIAFSWAAHTGTYLPLPAGPKALAEAIEDLRPILENPDVEKVGHNLKYDVSVLRWNGVRVQGRMFDTMIAHTLIDPDMRHGMDDVSEMVLNYTPIPITDLIGKDASQSMADVDSERVAEYAAEDADVTWQLRERFEQRLAEKGQTKVFFEIEMPLLPVLVEMEHAGIRINAAALADFSVQLGSSIAGLEKRVHELAGTVFNLNSPKQLGEVLFDRLKLSDKPKKTKTGQYTTDEATLEVLAGSHEIARALVNFRAASKLKSTYADALPQTIFPRTGRVHTTYNQAVTTTGRLQSQNPNLQNIPVRSGLGQEIRKAFVPQEGPFKLLSADYSQIELRIIAGLSGDAGLIRAFQDGKDIHTATAAAVHDVMEPMVTSDMRRTAKMVNFGIIYGISAFGLAQRLGIARGQSAKIIENYFALYPGIRNYMDHTISQAREKGYVETLTGRRRYLRDINSANAVVRGGAERNAINTPVQGTAADMIKIAMARIDAELRSRALKTRMLLQVHDELLFELFEPETETIKELVERQMRDALPIGVPVVVEMGIGPDWLEAHP